MLFGDFGDDEVLGSTWGSSILRGGKGEDELVGGNNRDLLVGDFGRDHLEGKAGSDFFVLRTDSNASEGLHNLTPNAAEADRIADFGADDWVFDLDGLRHPLGAAPRQQQRGHARSGAERQRQHPLLRALRQHEPGRLRGRYSAGYRREQRLWP